MRPTVQNGGIAFKSRRKAKTEAATVGRILVSAKVVESIVPAVIRVPGEWSKVRATTSAADLRASAIQSRARALEDRLAVLEQTVAALARDRAPSPRPQLTEAEQDALRALFEVRDANVFDAVAWHRCTQLLVAAAPRISTAFDGASLSLSTSEEDPTRLFVSVRTSEDVEPALARLDRMERDWWLAARGENAQVVLTLDFE